MVLIFGVYGACRRAELANLDPVNVEDVGGCFKVTIPDTKTKVSRTFVITSGNVPQLDLTEVVRKYIKLRPSKAKQDRFFVAYRNGKCINQVIGVNTVGDMPAKIATYLKLQNPKSYTGHCFRRSSASLLADAGADISVLKRHGGWRSTSVAEGYVENSLNNKISVANNIMGKRINIDNASSSAAVVYVNASPGTSSSRPQPIISTTHNTSTEYAHSSRSSPQSNAKPVYNVQKALESEPDAALNRVVNNTNSPLTLNTISNKVNQSTAINPFQFNCTNCVLNITYNGISK